jgi:hypothetical protein
VRGTRLITIAACLAITAAVATTAGLAKVGTLAAQGSAVFNVNLAAGGGGPAGTRPTVRGSVLFNVNRDAQGTVTSGTVTFNFTYRFPGSVTITGLHLHQGKRGQTGPLVIDAGIPTTVDADGTGTLNSSVSNAAPAALQAILANPRGYYVELHASGASLRQQLLAVPPFALPGSNSPAFALRLSPRREVPAVTGLNARAGGLVTFQLTRDIAHNIISGKVVFRFHYQFPGAVTITGLHIHQAVAGLNGPIVVDSGIASVPDPDGKGNIRATVNGVSPATLQAILDNPTGYYVNLHTSANPAGAMRSQLTQPRRL